MTDFTLEALKPLTSNQYDEARAKALQRVEKQIGEKPTWKSFKREYAPLATILDVFALIIFGAAFVVSSVHIAKHMQRLVINAGSSDVAIHQFTYVLMAEFAMLLFLVMFGTSGGWRRWVFFVLAGAALVFLFNANLQSNIGTLESILPPIFTVGIGFRLEYLIVEQLKRRAEIDAKFAAALSIWEAATQDSTKHPNFLPLLRTEIWNALLKKNTAFADVPVVFKRQAVSRELERETWAFETGGDHPLGLQTNGHGSDPRPLAAPLASLTTPEPVAN